MEWSKVKNVLILLFLCANILLAGLYALREYASRAVTLDARENLRLALSRQGVRAPELPPDTERAYTLSVRRVSSAEQALAGILLRAPAASEIGGGIVEYKGQTGQARFRSGGLFDALPDIPFSAPRDETDVDTPLGLLETLGFQVWPQTLRVEITQEETLVTALPQLEGRPVFNARLHLRYERGLLRDLSGRWVWGEVYRTQAQLCRTAGEIALRFCAGRRGEGSPVSHIGDMTLGYAAVRSQTEGFTDFVPVWRVTADGETYYVNGETGLLQNLDS